ncbi:MAG: hypothetical protein ABJE95_34965 [Byssovorax sp.]
MAARKTAVAKKATSAKKAAKPRRKTPAAEWAETYLPLTDAARERFAFLVREQGYAEPTVAVVPPDAVITFTKGADFVRVQSEYGGPPWVVVQAGAGERYGLPVIMAELDPAYASHAPVPAGKELTDDEMRAAVAFLAGFLEKHAAEVLRGDPALLARFKQREAALRVKTPTL